MQFILLQRFLLLTLTFVAACLSQQLRGGDHDPRFARLQPKWIDSPRLQLQAPAIENLGGRATRYLGRLPGAIMTAALLVAGALLVAAPRDIGWHHTAGETMVFAGIFSTLIISVKALRRNRGRR